MSVRIITVDNVYGLHCRYDRQTSSQDCYIELDCKNETLSANYNSEIGNAVHFSVYHGHIQRFGIPCLTNITVNNLMSEIAPLANDVIEGYESKWDGNNHVAVFTDKAEKAIEKIMQICDSFEADEKNSIIEYDAGDWLEYSIYRIDENGNSCNWQNCVKTVIHGAGEITSKTTDDELDKIEEKIISDVDSNIVLIGLSKFLAEERKNCEDNM